MVLYQCTKPDCPNFEAQKFYCVKCVADLENHVHKSEEIVNVKFIEDVTKRWAELNGLYLELFS